jgi:hypothetical protein
MRAIVILIEQFLLIVLLVFFLETSNALGFAMTAHVLGEISV